MFHDDCSIGSKEIKMSRRQEMCRATVASIAIVVLASLLAAKSIENRELRDSLSKAKSRYNVLESARSLMTRQILQITLATIGETSLISTPPEHSLTIEG